MVDPRGGAGKPQLGSLKVKSGRKRAAVEAPQTAPKRSALIEPEVKPDPAAQVADRVKTDILVERQNRETARDEVERTWARLDQISIEDEQNGPPETVWRLGSSDDPDMRVAPQTLMTQLSITALTAGAVWLLAFVLTS
ncbi:MAG: hypothetical protein KTR21_05975 [Rhodobacteraceae bacterium]|nr:hypothetical protein [Paracoccaceae bacterium]